MNLSLVIAVIGGFLAGWGFRELRAWQIRRRRGNDDPRAIEEATLRAKLHARDRELKEQREHVERVRRQFENRVTELQGQLQAQSRRLAPFAEPASGGAETSSPANGGLGAACPAHDPAWGPGSEGIAGGSSDAASPGDTIVEAGSAADEGAPGEPEDEGVTHGATDSDPVASGSSGPEVWEKTGVTQAGPVAERPAVPPASPSDRPPRKARRAEYPLQAIRGIGPVIAARLASSGIHSFEDLAHLDVEEVKRIAALHPGLRADPGRWIADAQRLAGYDGGPE
jgi:predicted flap endonuclease-1-like 5' DNA nuclease